MALSDKNLVSLVAAEHIGPTETGDNIDAKRAANYIWNPTGLNPLTGVSDGAWERQTAASAGGSDATAANQTTEIARLTSILATQTDGSQKTKITDSLGNSISAFPATFLRTSDEPRQLLYDPFDSTIDTTNTWTSTTANSGVAAANASGVMSLGTGTTASGWSKLVSKPTFKPTVPSWIGFSFLNIIPDLAAPTTNATRFWGAGTPATTPTTSAVMTDGLGFELVNSKMYCVLYAGGVRTVIQDLSAATGNSKQPTDALGHRYIIYIRTDKVYFYIDGLTSSQLVATGDFTYPNVQTASECFVAVGGPTPPAANSQIQSVGATVWDTGKNNTQLSDGTFPWRKATIGASGDLSVAQRSLSGSVSDGRSNTVTTPTDTSSAPLVQIGYPHFYNGSTWDRTRGDAANGLDVDVTRSVLPTGAATSANQTLVVTDLDYRYAGGKSSYVTTLAASGDTTLITPASGKRIQVYWVAFVPNSDNTAANLISLGYGTTSSSIDSGQEIYRGYAMAHWELFTGLANKSLIVNAGTAQPVAITIHYKEIT